MIIDLSCPVELRGYELLHDDAGTARAYIDLFNVSERTVTGYAGTVRWSRDETGESLNDSVSVDEIAIPAGGEFRLLLTSSGLNYADRLEIYFSRVAFEGAPEWKCGEGELVDVGEQQTLQGNELGALRAAAGGDAVMYPETQDNFWRCVCGRINPLSEAECARCRREREYVLGELNRKTLHLDPKQQRAREKRRAKSQKASAKAVKAQKNAKYMAALVAVSAFAFALLTVLVIINSRV